MAALATVAAHGEVHLVRRYPGYKKIRYYSHDNIGYGNIDLPDQELHTTALWWQADPEALDAVLPERQQAIEGFLGAAYALHHVAALRAMAEVRDLGRAVGDGEGTWFAVTARTGAVSSGARTTGPVEPGRSAASSPPSSSTTTIRAGSDSPPPLRRRGHPGTGRPRPGERLYLRRRLPRLRGSSPAGGRGSDHHPAHRGPGGAGALGRVRVGGGRWPPAADPADSHRRRGSGPWGLRRGSGG
jgi:hypothetical protein